MKKMLSSGLPVKTSKKQKVQKKLLLKPRWSILNSLKLMPLKRWGKYSRIVTTHLLPNLLPIIRLNPSKGKQIVTMYSSRNVVNSNRSAFKMILSFTDSVSIFQHLLCARYDQYFCFLSTTCRFLKNCVHYLRLNHSKVYPIEMLLQCVLAFQVHFRFPFYKSWWSRWNRILKEFYLYKNLE